jgi:hypothetical protein
MTPRMQKPKFWSSTRREETETSKPMKDFKIIKDYIQKLYLKDEISTDLYIKFISYIVQLYLEQMIEDKLDEIIPRWNKRFYDWLSPNLGKTF